MEVYDIQLKFTFETEKYHDVITHEQLVVSDEC
jgi:hypothetical protein